MWPFTKNKQPAPDNRLALWRSMVESETTERLGRRLTDEERVTIQELGICTLELFERHVLEAQDSEEVQRLVASMVEARRKMLSVSAQT